MDESLKKKNIYVIMFEIVIIVLGIVGVTLATSNIISGRTKTILTAGIYEIDYKGNLEVVGSDLEPISDSLININTKESVLRAEFSFKGTEKNTDDLIYDIMIKDMNIDTVLMNEYTKWNLYKNGELLSHGNFSPQFDSRIVTEDMILTNIQEDLPKYDQGYDNYVLIIWISEACEDLLTCEYVDQSYVVNSRIGMNVFVAVNNSGKVENVRVASVDESKANGPKLYEGMIPVYYDDGEWKIADKFNGKENPWYSYQDSKWANAVITSNNKYSEEPVGTVVEGNDIVGMFVWIPRFKYKTWNVEEEITDSYNAYEKGIQIRFEGGTISSGNLVCNLEECNLKNDMEVTHPVFKDGERGFWVSKYEASDRNGFIGFKGGQTVITSDDVSTYLDKFNMFVSTYKFGNESHIINNLEWGSITYLTHSKYGLCKEDYCLELGNNDTLISGSNKQDTTTRNVYGVYDMSGSAAEYVAGIYRFGTALEEMLINEDYTWEESAYTNNKKEYILRGGSGNTLYSVNDMGMFNMSTRLVLSK